MAGSYEARREGFDRIASARVLLFDSDPLVADDVGQL
jgi:hypothetical protein